MKKSELTELLTKVGVKLTGEEKHEELAKLFRENKDKIAALNGGGAGGNAGSGSSEKTSGKGTSEGDPIVWLKTRAYINDTERVDAGVYRFEKVPARLTKLSARECEVFANGVVSPRKLAEIAKWAGIKHPEDFEDDELLSRVISTPQPFTV